MFIQDGVVDMQKDRLIEGRGLVHLYLGDGKGKTSAAFGLALRCRGCGGRVAIVQFLKTVSTGEVDYIHQLEDENLCVYRFESSHGFFFQLSEEQKDVLKMETVRALTFVQQKAAEGEYDMLVLDELLGAVENGLVEQQQLFDILAGRADGVEMVLTGRNAPQELIDAADYVTRLIPVKHPYERGISARRGIEY